MRRHDPTYMRLVNCQKWRDLRTAYLAQHPRCEDCAARGLIVAATEVHHVKPIETARSEAEARQLAYNSTSNLRALCRECHHAVHRAMMSHSRESVQRREEARIERFLDAFKPKRPAVNPDATSGE